MKFGQSMDVEDPKFDPKGQGHRSKVRVNRSKTSFQSSFDSLMGKCKKN